MKITSEELDADGYTYNVKLRDYDVFICECGVSLHHPDGSMVDTNIDPEGLFPGAKRLTDEQVLFIARMAVEGRRYSPDDIARLIRNAEERNDNENLP